MRDDGRMAAISAIIRLRKKSATDLEFFHGVSAIVDSLISDESVQIRLNVGRWSDDEKSAMRMAYTSMGPVDAQKHMEKTIQRSSQQIVAIEARP